MKALSLLSVFLRVSAVESILAFFAGRSERRSNGFLHLPRAKAASADTNALDRSFFQDADALQVRIEFP
jgi:hypothetical protein